MCFPVVRRAKSDRRRTPSGVSLPHLRQSLMKDANRRSVPRLLSLGSRRCNLAVALDATAGQYPR